MFDRNLLKLEGMGGVFAALVMLALLQAGCVIGIAYSLAEGISELWAGATVESQIPAIVMFFACYAVRRIAVFAQETMLDCYSESRSEQLRNSLLAKVFSSGLNARELGSAAVATTATQGIDDVQEYIRIIPPKIIGIAATALPLLVAECVADWPSGVILAVMFPVIFFFMVLLGRQARDRAQRQYASYQRLSNHFLDTLRGIDTVVASGAVQRTEDDVHRSSEALRKATVRTLTTATLSSAVLDLSATFGTAAVAVMLAFRLMDGSIGLGTGLFALMIAPEYFSPIRAFASDFHASLDGKNALSSVLDVIGDVAPAQAMEPGAGCMRSKPDCAISFSDVSYSYPGSSEEAVRNLNFEVRRGEHVAIIGKSGSGKSTLAALAAGFIAPTGGAVLTSLPVHFIPQDPYIFRAKLSDNVRLYSSEASDDEVEKAIDAVGLGDFVRELPHGLDTRIGEGERGLSGGQAHRIAIARALLDPEERIIVFDEPTAHLDIETELELKEHILPLLEGRTVLFATHRMHWIGDMDRALALVDGELSNARPRIGAEGGAR